MTCSRRRFLTGTALALGSMVTSGKAAASGADKPVLKFKDGRFRILQLTDLHTAFHTPEKAAQSEETLGIVRQMLDKEKPDLAVVTGDIIGEGATLLPGGLPGAWESVTRLFDEANTPFVITFGNHDHEREATMAEQLAMIARARMNLTYSADPTHPGAGTCFLPILGADDSEAARLWFFDSFCLPPREDLGGYDWIKNEQIQWYRTESLAAANRAGHPVPGLAFFHIPLPEYWKVNNPEVATGNVREDPCSPELNSGLFTAMIECGDIVGVFVGHNHTNDYIALYKGIALAFGRMTHAGYSEYGARVIELTEGKAGFDTHISTPRGEEFPWSYLK